MMSIQSTRAKNLVTAAIKYQSLSISQLIELSNNGRKLDELLLISEEHLSQMYLTRFEIADLAYFLGMEQSFIDRGEKTMKDMLIDLEIIEL